MIFPRPPISADEGTVHGPRQPAMRDTMARAAALTGGYGSSYSQTVGQQSYEASLSGLQSLAPQLYELAYQRYQDTGADMRENLSLLQALEEAAYGRYRDTVGDYYTDRDYYAGAPTNGTTGLWPV